MLIRLYIGMSKTKTKVCWRWFVATGAVRVMLVSWFSGYCFNMLKYAAAEGFSNPFAVCS